MSDSKLQPYADLKYKARTYIDKEGKEKGVWVTVGTLFSSPHGSHMSIKMDSIPVGEWNGWLSVYKRDEQDDRFLTQHEVLNEAHKDNLPTDEDLSKPLDFEIPF
jgi:hypothetical protein